MATRPPSLHDFFIGRAPQTQTDVAYSNVLDSGEAERARKANIIGRDIGLPGATVTADMEGFGQEQHNNRTLSILGTDPHIVSFLGDQHNAASVKDDLPALSDISTLFRMGEDPTATKGGWANYMRNTRAGRTPLLNAITLRNGQLRDYSLGTPIIADPLKGYQPIDPRTPRAAPPPPPPGIVDLLGGVGAGTLGSILQSGQGAESYLADALDSGKGSMIGDFLRRDVAATQPNVTSNLARSQDVYERIPTYIGQQSYSAVQSIAQMGAAILSDNPIPFMGMQQGLQQYQQVRDRGGSPNEALFSGAVSGGAESAFEKYFGLGWVLGNFGKKATSKFVGGLLLREVPSEVATTAVQDLADAMVTGGGGWQAYKERLPADLLNTAASTAIMVGMMGGAHRVRNQLAPQARAVNDIERAAAGSQFVDDLMAAAVKSKTKAEDPQTLKEFIDHRTQDSPVRNLYVPVEAAVSYMQSEKYGGELDRYQDQIAQAQNTQGDVVIPIGDAVANLSGTPAWDALKEDVRIEPGGLSRKEAAAQHGEIIDQLEKRGREIAAQADDKQDALDAAGKVYTEVKNRLRLSGVDDRQADAVAQIYAARYEARAARLGGTPMEQFQRSKITFPGEAVGQFEGGREVAQSVVNIGLNIPGGGQVAREDALKALRAQGVEVIDHQVRQSATEPTLIARLSKPLSAKQGHAVSAALGQEAIAQRTGEKGKLFGPQAAKWGPFNPEFFLDFQSVIDTAQARTPKQDVMPEAGWTPERVSGLIDQFGNEDGSSSALAVMMSPDEYLAMNANAAGRETIAKRVAEMEKYGGKLDVQRLSNSPPIYLGVALGGPNDTRPPPMVRGHDGRHRMALLKAAGVARVPVIVSLTDKDGKPIRVTEPMKVSNIIPNRSRSDQMSTGDRVGEVSGVPISFRYQDQLESLGRRVLFQSGEDVFYSALERTVANAPQEKATAAQWKALLTPGKTPGIKAEEIEWSGIHDWLDMQKGPVNKDALLHVIRENGIKVEEVVLGEPADMEAALDVMRGDEAFEGYSEAELRDAAKHDSWAPATQFSSWSSDQLNPTYRELLITLPQGVGSNPARAPSTHWDTEGVVAHLRFMEKTDAEGKRVLFIEEVQSDWHQKGRDQGYETALTTEQAREQQEKVDRASRRLERAEVAVIEKAPEVLEKWREAVTGLPSGFDESKMSEIGIARKKTYERLLHRIALWQKVVGSPAREAEQGDVLVRETQDLLANELKRFITNMAFEPLMRDELQGYEQANLDYRETLANKNRSGIPEAPFKSSWPALVMKRAIRWAVDNGFEKVAWTTGEEQAQRYNLEKHIGRVTFTDNTSGGIGKASLEGGNTHGELTAYGPDGRQIFNQHIDLERDPNALAGIIGKELADKLLAAEPEHYRSAGLGLRKRELTGLDLKTGGEGMKAFYDRNLVNITNDIIKKYGAKVEAVAVNQNNRTEGQTQRLRDRLEQERATMTPEQIARVEAQIKYDSEGDPHPGFEITPKLREAASSGFALFQGERGSTTFTDDGAKLIQLFSTADRSTLLHETGHIWLEELKADAADDEASAKDWEIVKKWFTNNGFAVSKDGFIPTEAHEIWARGVERYFMEGKSPSLGLAGVFRTFKSWLLRIYSVVQNLNTPITPEVREVMDRLIATQDAIDDARAMNATEPLFKSAEDAQMTDAEFADYSKRVGDARDEAYDALLFKMMESIRKRKSGEMRDARAAVRAEVGEVVNKQPQFRLLHLLRTGKWLGEPERPAVSVKLNTGWLIDNFGEAILGQLPRGIQIWSGSGETGDVIAEMVGMGSGSEVVQTLVGMRAASDELRRMGETRSMRDRLIGEETDRVMAERYGDPLIDGTIEEEAIAAINSARQGEIIAAEARQLAKRQHVLGVPTPYQFAREWARRTVSAGHVRDVASRAALQRYVRATNKAARAAEAAILEGDVDEAYRQKQAQLLNHALLAEAKAAADRVDRIITKLKKLAGRAAMKSIDPEYFEKIQSLLENYDFKQRSERSIDEQVQFQAWLEAQRAKGFEVHIPPRLDNNGTPYTRVSVQELESLGDLVDSLVTLGRLKQKIKVAQGERDFSEYRDEVVARISQLPDRKLPAKPINEEERKIAAMASELLKVETLAEELDGGPVGPLHDVLVLGATTAENLRHTLREKVMIPLAQMYHQLGRKYWRHLQERVTIPELTWNTLNEGDPRLGSPVTITRSELLAIFMNMGNLSNLEKLSRGERWNVDALKKVMDRELTKEDTDFAQQMWDTVEKLWPDIVNVEREMSGVVPERVVNNPIETKHGTLRGGYWPIIYDPARWQRAEDLEGKEIDDMFGLKSGVATQKGHTITRTGAFGPINLSLERVLFHHIEQVVTRIAFAPYARDVLRTIRDKMIRGWIDTKLGPEYRRQIEPWLGRQIHNGYAFPKGARWWDHLMRGFRINTTIAAMGFRISTGVAQTLGLGASAQRIGSRWVGVGLMRLAQRPREAARFAYTKSPELYHRTEAVNREVMEISNRMRQKHKWWTDAQHWAMMHIAMIDRYMVSLPTWLGAYEKGRTAMDMTDEEAVAFADKSVRMSQGTGREKDMAAVQSPNSEAMRFFTMFYTPFNVMFNAQWQGLRGVKKGTIRPLIAVTWWWLMAQTLGSALMGGDWPEFDDPEDVAKWFARNVFFGMFAGIPIARDAANAVNRALAGQYASDIGTTPITRVGEAIRQAWNQGKRKVKTGENPKRPIKEAGDLTAILLGLPTSQVATTAQFAWDVHEGAQDPKSVSDWYFGLTQGKVPKPKE